MGTVEQAQNSRGTGIAPGGVANTKGNYGELISSTPFDAHGVLIHLEGPMDVSSRALADISIGPLGSEQIILTNLHVDATNRNVAASFHFPIGIPEKTRISARVQHNGTAAHVRLAGHLYSSGFADFSPLSKVVTYGADTTDSGGATIDPGAVAGTKGAWTGVATNTTSHISQLLMAIGSGANGTRSNTSWLVDVGIGPAGQETLLEENIPLVFNGGYIQPKIIGPKPVSIPNGTRVSIRASCTNTDATDRLFDIVLYGVS